MRCRDVPALPWMSLAAHRWDTSASFGIFTQDLKQQTEPVGKDWSKTRFTPELPAASIDITADTTGLPGNSIATLWSICRDVQWKRFDLFPSSRRVTSAHSCPSKPCVKVYSR